MQADIFRTIQQMQHLYFRLCGMAARVVVKDCDMTLLVAEWQDTFITRVVIATVEDYMTDYHVKLDTEFGLIVAGLILEGVGASLWRVFACTVAVFDRCGEPRALVCDVFVCPYSVQVYEAVRHARKGVGVKAREGDPRQHCGRHGALAGLIQAVVGDH